MLCLRPYIPIYRYIKYICIRNIRPWCALAIYVYRFHLAAAPLPPRGTTSATCRLFTPGAIIKVHVEDARPRAFDQITIYRIGQAGRAQEGAVTFCHSLELGIVRGAYPLALATSTWFLYVIPCVWFIFVPHDYLKAYCIKVWRHQYSAKSILTLVGGLMIVWNFEQYDFPNNAILLAWKLESFLFRGRIQLRWQ